MRNLLLALLLILMLMLITSAPAADALEELVYLLKCPSGIESILPPGAEHLFGEWYRTRTSPEVVYALSAYGVRAELDGVISVDAAPNDQFYIQPAPISRGGAVRQWWLDKISIPDAWDTATGSGINIAVVDSGYSLGHPDLPIPAVQYDLIDGGAAQDEHGHGTHVAGIIAATADNGIGIAGAARAAAIGVWRVLGQDGTGAVGDVAQAIVQASNWADVINLSLGTRTKYDILQDAIATARGNGAVTVCAAGNDGSNVDFYPAVWCDLAVGAVDEFDRKADFSNYGFWWVDVAAPGVSILSTMPITASWLITRSGYYAEYDAMSGTSMAAPQVSAVVALAMSAYRCSGPESCRQLICGTSDRIAGTGTLWACGRVNALALRNQPQPTPTPWFPTPTATPPWPATPTPLPTQPPPTPTPFSYPPPAVLPPWGISMSLPVLATPATDPDGIPVIAFSSEFLSQKSGVDSTLGSVVNALNQANSAIDDFEAYVGTSALGAEALLVISGSVNFQASEVRGYSVDELRGVGEDAMRAQVAVLSSLAGEPPTLQEAAAMIGISAAQPVAYLRGWGMLMATANDNPHGQLFTFISAMVGLVLLFLVLLIGITIIRYMLLPVASAVWNLLRDVWEAIPFIG